MRDVEQSLKREVQTRRFGLVDMKRLALTQKHLLSMWKYCWQMTSRFSSYPFSIDRTTRDKNLLDWTILKKPDQDDDEEWGLSLNTFWDFRCRVVFVVCHEKKSSLILWWILWMKRCGENDYIGDYGETKLNYFLTPDNTFSTNRILANKRVRGYL